MGNDICAIGRFELCIQILCIRAPYVFLLGCLAAKYHSLMDNERCDHFACLLILNLCCPGLHRPSLAPAIYSSVSLLDVLMHRPNAAF